MKQKRKKLLLMSAVFCILAVFIFTKSRMVKQDGYVYLLKKVTDGTANAPISMEKDAGALSGFSISRNMDYTSWQFEIKEPGEYKLWFRVHAFSGNDDSYHVQMDDQPKFLWNSFPKNKGYWAWQSAREGRVEYKNKTFQFTKGIHTLKIKQRDADNPKLDQLIFTNDLNFDPDQNIKTEDHEYLIIEAETANIPGVLFTVEEDSTALGGKCIAPPDGRFQLPFHAPVSDTFVIWSRYFAPNHGADSFWIMMDDSAQITMNNLHDARWVWQRLHNGGDSTHVKYYYLDKGNHNLSFLARESGLKKDMFIITNDMSFTASDTNAIVSKLIKQSKSRGLCCSNKCEH